MTTLVEESTKSQSIRSFTRRDAYKALQAHYKQMRMRHLRELFAEDPERGKRFAAEAVGLFFDYSKNRITDETLELLVKLADESGLRQRIEAMFRGDKINVTEKRAVLHVALRAPEVLPFLSMAKTLYRRFMTSSIGWRPSPSVSGAASGPGTPGKESAT